MKLVMKWLLSTFFVLTHALTPKLCIHCKHFMHNSSPEFGKCRLFPRNDIGDNYFVTGKNDVKKDYHYCSTSRQFESLCGNNGKYFIELDTFNRLH
jgi:hypothetical protein